MALRILTFGQITAVTGKSGFEIEAAGVPDTDTLQQRLYSLYPALRHTRHVLAVDKKIISGNTLLSPTAEIAVLPPFSGG